MDLFRIFSLAFFIVISGCAFGQTGFLYQDAMTLYQRIHQTDLDKQEVEVNQILRYYTDTQKKDASQIIDDNPFLKKVVALHHYAKLTKAGEPFGSPTGSGLTNMMGLDVTNLADGIAKFLIERGKQELSMAFFDRMKKEFKRYPELQYFFPQTSLILNNIEDHNVLTLLQELKDAFTKDLRDSPENLLAMREANIDCAADDKDCETRIEKIKNSLKKSSLVISLYTMRGLSEGQSINSILNQVISDGTFCDSVSHSASAIKFSSIMLDALRSSEASTGFFISDNQLNALFESPDLLLIWLGLTYEKYKSRPCYNNLQVDGLSLLDLFNQIEALRFRYAAALGTFDPLNQVIISLRDTRRDRTKDEALNASLIKGSIRSFNNIIGSLPTLTGKNSTSTLLATLSKNIETGSGLSVDIRMKNYAGVFNGIMKLMDDNDVFKDEKQKQRISKYLSFAANLATADNSDDVRDVIEAAALPPGSYAVKQRTAFSAAFNGYIGYGWDMRSGEVQAHGLYAPVGFSLSMGLGKERGGALTFFASAIDVGALVSYRLRNGMTDDLKQEVRLESIVSPSAQLIFGIPRLPVSLVAGWKKTPKLFYKDVDGFMVVTPRNRLNFSVLIDIPFFNLYTSGYR